MRILRLLNFKTALLGMVFLGLLALIPADLVSATPASTTKTDACTSGNGFSDY